ncbi:MAG TPA: UvrD-helicase domain-containing protein, partial [Dissulfurispiraceae bacterium]|nr:UvrD-helicase domain-containing protein [Dissulfurispiraceae bacterium]
VLLKDSDLTFPHFAVLKASAGSGKTFSLSQRFVQFLLSSHVPHNRLRNILAMTFSNNAAKEMRGRILGWLKKIALGDAGALNDFEGLVFLPRDEMRVRAAAIIENILEHYGDFQVRTIDSFTTALFQASALDFGYPPEFEIILDNAALTEYAFQRYLRRVSEGSAEAELIDKTILSIVSQKQGGAAYVWDPSSALLEEVRNIADLCASRGKTLVCGNEEQLLDACARELRITVDELAAEIRVSGLETSKASTYYKSDMPALARQGRISDLIGKKLKAAPVNKPKKKTPELLSAQDRVLAVWDRVRQIICRATFHYAYSFYEPYVSVYLAFNSLLEDAKRRQGKVFIGDINRHLAVQLSQMSVPDIYFRIGDTIHHFFIDEFQDTSPVQWKTLFPLLENAVAERGSVFLVGDTKQAIYGFRDADYRIMAEAGHVNPFPSAAYIVRDLDVNFRSGASILELNERIFHQTVLEKEEYKEASKQSGLNNYQQHADPKRSQHGFVSVSVVQRTEDGEHERRRLAEIIADLIRRQYDYGDIAILTQRNEDAIRITGWLNEQGIEFLSFSSLDIRRRSVTSEIISLLRFLDSPTDSLSFAAFIMGDIFTRACAAAGILMHKDKLQDFLVKCRRDRALYPLFAAGYRDAWERFFGILLKSVGYLPLYDLVSQIYYVFDLFSIYAEEEATLMRLLETVKDFEGLGYNSLSEFLRFADAEESADAEWRMTVPAAQDAVRVMTIHKAKGLDFPVTIVMLYEQPSRGLGYVTDEDGEDLRLLRITREMADCNDGLQDKYGDARLKEMVNGLNMLYVGLTRPRDELHVIGIAAKPEAPSYPIDLFTDLAAEEGEKLPKESEKIKMAAGLMLEHGGRQMSEMAVSGGPLRFRERRRGEVLHSVLAAINVIDRGASGQISDIVALMRREGKLEPDEECYAEALPGFLSRGDVVRYFSPMPHRKVFTEFEVAAANGRLYRIDRLILDADMITVMDFKTGSDEEYSDQYEYQIRTYAGLIKDCYPGKQVECILAYIDSGKVKRIA